jgi:phosphoribosylglycinamide formyltransferase-1
LPKASTKAWILVLHPPTLRPIAWFLLSFLSAGTVLVRAHNSAVDHGVFIVRNKTDAGGLAKAKASGIPTLTIESKPCGKDRAGFEAALQSALDQHKADLICLGGFMRLFTAEFVQRWYGRMLNIHPSLLPSFPGLDPHGQALRAGVKISGATVHFVIPETDAGPIVMQGAVAVRDDDTADRLAARPDALRLLASGRIRLDGELCKTDGSAGSSGTLISPAV